MKRIFLCLGLAALTLGGCSRNDSSSDSPAAAPAEASPAGMITLAADSPKLQRIQVKPLESVYFPLDEVVAPGKIEANPNRIARIVTPVAGQVRQVLVQLGDSVKQGQPLLIVSSPDAGAALAGYRQIQAQVRQAQSSLNKAEKDLERLRDLYQHGAAPLKEVTAAENDQVQAQSALEQAQAAYADAAHRLDLLGLKLGQSSEITIAAPIPGKVLDIAVVPGEYRNDTSSSLMTIADLSTVWVTSNVPENSIRFIQPGERIDLELAAFPGEPFQARVKRIADTVDPETRSIRVQAELSNPLSKLRPEMFGTIRHSHGSLRLPAVPGSALVQRSGGFMVLIEVSTGSFKTVAVSAGEPKNGLIPIRSGLKGDERIVVDGAVLLGNH